MVEIYGINFSITLSSSLGLIVRLTLVALDTHVLFNVTITIIIVVVVVRECSLPLTY